MKAQLLEKNLLPQMTEHKEKIAEGLWNKIEQDDFYNHEECYLCQRPVRFQDAEGNPIKHHSVRAYHGLATIMSVETSDMIGESYNGVEAEIVDKKGNVISETTIDEGGEGGKWVVGSCCAKKLGKKWVRVTDHSKKITEEPVEEPAEEPVEEVVATPKKENSRQKYSVRLTKKQIEVLMDRMQIEIYNHDPSCPVSSEPNIDKIFLAILNNADKAIGGGGGYDLKFFN